MSDRPAKQTTQRPPADDLTIRLDRFRHYDDEEVSAVTTEAANEICRLEAEIERLRAALAEIATGRDANGLKTDFPRERAQEALNGR